MQLSASSILDAGADSGGGSFKTIISNSTVRLSQGAPNAIDLCSICGVTAVNVTSSGALAFIVKDQSVISVSCAVSSTLFSSLQSSRFAFQMVADDGAQIYLSTASLTHRVASGHISGSFVVLLENSYASNSSISISNCSVTCGFVCQLVGVVWEDSPVLNFALLSLLGYLPPAVTPRLINSSIAVRQCSITTLVPPAHQSIERRSLVSLANTTNTNIEVMGPLEFSTDGFSSIVDSSGGGGDLVGTNRLALLNCDAIHVSQSPLVVGRSAVKLPLKQVVALPMGLAYLNVESIRTGGVGSCGLTTSISSDVTASSTLTRSSATQSPSAAIPLMEVKWVMPLSRAVVAGSAGFVALVSGPAMALSVQVLHAQMLISGCHDAATDEPLDVASSPTQLSFGRAAGMYTRGAVVGNVMLLAACLLAARIAVLFVVHFQRRAASAIGFPGILYLPYSILVVPTVSSATMLLVPPLVLATPQFASDLAVSTAGLAVALGPLIVLAALTTTRRWFGARPVRVSMRGIRGSAMRRKLKIWFKRRFVFDNLPGRSGFVQRWEYAGITDYVAHRQWFVLLEQALGLATGLIAGLTALGVGWCTALNAMQSVVTVALLAALILMRPHSVRADQWVAVSSSLLESATALLGLLGRDVSMLMLVVQLVVSTLYLAGLLSKALVDGGLFCSRDRDRRCSRNSDDAMHTEGGLLVAGGDELLSVISCARLCATREEALKVLVGAACRKPHT